MTRSAQWVEAANPVANPAANPVANLVVYSATNLAANPMANLVANLVVELVELAEAANLVADQMAAVLLVANPRAVMACVLFKRVCNVKTTTTAS